MFSAAGSVLETQGSGFGAFNFAFIVLDPGFRKGIGYRIRELGSNTSRNSSESKDFDSITTQLIKDRQQVDAEV